MSPIERLNAARRDLDAAQKEHDEALSAVRRQLSGYNVEVDTTTVNPNKKNTDNQALLVIQEILGAVEWTPDTPEHIASIMQEAGYTIEDTK